MSYYGNILIVSVVAAVLMFGGMPRRSTAEHWQSSPDFSGPSAPACLLAPLPWPGQDRPILVAAADEDSEDSGSDKKDGDNGKDDEDGGMKDLWDSVLLG